VDNVYKENSGAQAMWIRYYKKWMTRNGKNEIFLEYLQVYNGQLILLIHTGNTLLKIVIKGR